MEVWLHSFLILAVDGGEIYTAAALREGSQVPGFKGGLVDLRAGLNAAAKRGQLCTCLASNGGRRARESVTVRRKPPVRTLAQCRLAAMT